MKAFLNICIKIFLSLSLSLFHFISILFQLLQVLIQTPMIMDGLRRCSNSEKNKREKPGRELVTFLIIANLIIYLWDTLEVKNTGIFSNPKKYYGKSFWITVSHMTLPLCIFYRFHAAVALVDIWSSAYRPASSH